MAHRIANSSDTLASLTAWDTGTNVPTINAATNITVSNVNLFSATFTAPNTTNKSTGVLIFMASKASQNWTATLQESSVDTAATATITNANMATTNLAGASPVGQWVYFRWGTPYTFTTTAAGTYRIKLVASASSTGTAAADSGGSNFAYLATDDRTGALGATDDIWVVSPNANTSLTMTVTGTGGTVGSGTDVTGGGNHVNPRSIGNAINIFGNINASSCVVAYDATASATLVVKGSIISWFGGEFQMGTVASPYPAAFTAHLQFNQNGTSGNYGISSCTGGKITWQGASKTFYSTKYVSGVGTVVSPLVTADNVNWSVGDELLVGATGNDAANYNENEKMFIITVNAANSYVLSSTSGGAATALSFTHSTDAWILNVTRNVLIDTTNTAQAWYGSCVSSNTLDNNIKWARLETVGANVGTSFKQSFFPVFATGGTQTAFDYSIIYRSLERGMGFNTGPALATYTNNIFCYQNSSASVGTLFCGTGANKTFSNCFFMGNNRYGIEVNGAPGFTFNNCYVVGNNTSNSTTAVNLINTGSVAFNSCEFHCNRTAALNFSGASNTSFSNSLFGTKGINQTVDIAVVANTSNVSNVFNGCSFSSTTLISGYTAAATSDWNFQTANGTVNNHFWYTNLGSSQSTGAGLSDTNTRTSGELSVRLSPQTTSSTGQWVQWNVVATPNSTVFVQGYIQQNAAFTGDAAAACRVDLWLPGLIPGTDAASYSYTMPKTDNNFDPFVVYAAYGAGATLLATVRVTAVSSTANAYAYVADLYNGGSALSNMSTWYNGRPASLIVQTAGDAATIWAYPTASLTTSGTTGNQLAAKVLTTSKFIGLK